MAHDQGTKTQIAAFMLVFAPAKACQHSSNLNASTRARQGYYGAAPPVPNAAQPGYGYGYGYGPQQGAADLGRGGFNF